MPIAAQVVNEKSRNSESADSILKIDPIVDQLIGHVFYDWFIDSFLMLDNRESYSRDISRCSFSVFVSLHFF